MMPDEKKYAVNEIYYALQGEGVRYGIPHVFVRFAKCNLACGFCDTEFESYVPMTGPEILKEARRLSELAGRESVKVEGAINRGSEIERGPCRNVLFCGGEPLLQLDDEILELFKADGWFLVTETNGTREIPKQIDWATCSPKVAEHALKPEFVNELKYVRAAGQGIPRPKVEADHYSLSPMFEGNELDEANLAWCIKLVEENPQWRLTVQHHKVSFGGMR